MSSSGKVESLTDNGRICPKKFTGSLIKVQNFHVLLSDKSIIKICAYLGTNNYLNILANQSFVS